MPSFGTCAANTRIPIGIFRSCRRAEGDWISMIFFFWFFPFSIRRVRGWIGKIKIQKKLCTRLYRFSPIILQPIRSTCNEAIIRITPKTDSAWIAREEVIFFFFFQINFIFIFFSPPLFSRTRFWKSSNNLLPFSRRDFKET